MQTENVNIETIERYLKGDMPAAERDAFRARLAEDESLQAEVSEVEAILNGFQSLRETQLLADFRTWDEEWTATDETDLIEAYLQGNLSAENRERVSQRLKTDPAFEEKVKSHQKLASGFEAIRSEEFAGRLRAWETEAVRTKTRKLVPMRTIFLRVAAAASILLVAAVGLNWYADSRFSSWALEDDFYSTPNLGGTLGQDTSTTNPLVIAFEKGHQQMKSKEFLDAEGTFNNVLALVEMMHPDPLSAKNYRENAEWNILLAKLGRNEFGSNFQEQLDAIIRNPDHTYHDRAVALKAKMETFWFRWAN
ncbi:MAG: hypothetical protein H6562_16885 [Lewinellaceae bacterium]|nr:hypothetical protein [Lewinellaceae bacterium]